LGFERARSAAAHSRAGGKHLRLRSGIEGARIRSTETLVAGDAQYTIARAGTDFTGNARGGCCTYRQCGTRIVGACAE